nr:hypothetical protein [Tanacetum cinerariifolium]
MEASFLRGKDASKKGGLAAKVKLNGGSCMNESGQVGFNENMSFTMYVANDKTTPIHAEHIKDTVPVAAVNAITISIDGADVAIPCAVVDEVSAKFANTLYGYFIGEHLAFLTMETYVTYTWAKYGFERAICRNGIFFFKFASHEGVVKTLEAFSETRLSLIATQLGRPIMLDACTSNTCLNPWGRNYFARVLVELASYYVVKESVVMAIPLSKGEGHYLEVLDVASVSIAEEVNRSNYGLKLKQKIGNKAANKNGFRFSKPKNNLIYQPVSKPITSKANTPKLKTNVPPIKEVVNEAASQPCVSQMVNTNDSSGLINEYGYFNDDVDISQIRSNIEKLMDEEKVPANTKVVHVEAKGNEKGSLLEQFRKLHEVSSSKLNSISDSKEFEVEEVCIPECLPGRGFLDDMEDDLDCFDGYEAQVYDLTEQETMDTTIDQQVARDEALVPHVKRLRIGRRNFCLLSDIKSKESTLQLVYDVLRLTPFFKAILVTADVLKIYMQEFWATATVHHHSIRFKMENKKHIINLESFREIKAIKRLTDVNINKLHQPWRSFVAIINKCLTGKSSGYDSLRWNTKIQRKAMRCLSSVHKGYHPPLHVKGSVYSKEEQGPRLTTSEKGKQAAKASKAKSLSALSEVAMTEAQQLKLATKRSLQQTHISQAIGSGADEGTGTLPGVPDVPTDEPEEDISWKSTDDEGDDDEGNDSGDDDGEEGDGDDDDGEEGNDYDDDQEDEWDDEEECGDDEQAYDEEEFIHPSLSTHAEEETRDEESFDPIQKTPKNSNDEENLGTNVGREEGHDEEEEKDELYRDVNINQGRGIQMTQEFEDSHVTLTSVNPDGQQQSLSVSSQFVTSMLNPTPDAGMESIFETTSQTDVQTPTSVAPLPMSAPTITPSTIATITTILQAPTPPTTAPSTRLQDLPDFGSLFGFDNQRKLLESGRLHDEAQADNDEFLKTIDENMQKIIKEQVKEQVKVQVSKILPKIEQIVNEQLEAEVLTWSSNSSKTSYAVAADLSEMELKKILIEKIKCYKETITLKRSRDDDADKDKEPSAGPDRGSKRRKEGKEPESASAPKEKATTSTGKSTQGSQSRQTSARESAIAEEPMQTTFELEEPSHLEFETDRDYNKTLPPTHESIQPWISELAKQSDSRSSFNELMDTPVDFSNFLMNQLKVDTLTPELLADPTYELMKGSCKSLVELKFLLEEVYKATTDQLDWINPEGASSRKYTTSVTKTKAADYGDIKWIEDLVPRTISMVLVLTGESARDVYSKSRIIAVTELKIVEWHNYKQLDWITVRRDDDKLYKFKEGDFKRLRIQDIEDMLMLLLQGKLTNLTVKERFAFNVSLRMFTKSFIIQRRVEDLQLGVKSYQKKINLTKPDTYRFDLKRKEAYIAYSNPRGFIYQNKDKQNRLMQIDELHKFSDGTLTDVRTTLDDRLKGIRMKFLPQSIWRKSDKDRAVAMI